MHELQMFDSTKTWKRLLLSRCLILTHETTLCSMKSDVLREVYCSAKHALDTLQYLVGGTRKKFLLLLNKHVEQPRLPQWSIFFFAALYLSMMTLQIDIERRYYAQGSRLHSSDLALWLARENLIKKKSSLDSDF